MKTRYECMCQGLGVSCDDGEWLYVSEGREKTERNNGDEGR